MKLLEATGGGDGCDIVEEVIIGVGRKWGARGLEAEGPVERGVDWTGLEEVAHLFMSLDDEGSCGIIKALGFVGTRVGTEVFFTKFFVWVHFDTTEAYLISFAGGIEEVVGARRVSHVRIVVVEGGGELLINRSGWYVKGRLIFSNILFKNSLSRGAVFWCGEGCRAGITKEVDIGGVVKMGGVVLIAKVCEVASKGSHTAACREEGVCCEEGSRVSGCGRWEKFQQGGHGGFDAKGSRGEGS